MKKYFLIFALFFVATPAFAANTQGYAWSESLGWFDFSNMVVSDTAVTGHAYNDNTGWLVLDGIANTNGTLSGYAWSESVGYFDFSDVYIENGSLAGYAYNDNTGFLSFEDDTNVTTTWTSAEPQQETRRRSSSSGSRVHLNEQTTGGNTNNDLSTPNTISDNTRDLEFNMTGDDVKLLQQFLNSRGFIINTNIGQPGSIGYETTYFGNLTKQALIKFQQTHNITPSMGYFGPKTRAFIKTLINNN